MVVWVPLGCSLTTRLLPVSVAYRLPLLSRTTSRGMERPLRTVLWLPLGNTLTTWLWP